MKSIWIGCLFGCVFFVACQEDIPINIDGQQPQLVVFSLNDVEESFEVRVARTRVLNDSLSPLTVDEPNVRLFYSNGVEIPMYNDFGVWSSREVLPEAGKSYRLTVSHPYFNSVSAFASFPNPPRKVESFIIPNVQTDSMGFDYDELNVWVEDNPNEDNFYQIQLYYFNNARNEFVPFAPDNISDDNVGVIRTPEGAFVFNDEMRNGQTIKLAFTFNALTATREPRYIVELSNLSNDMYRFLRTQSLYNRYNVTVEYFSLYNPIQVFSNIENGVGIFAGKTVLRDTIR